MTFQLTCTVSLELMHAIPKCQLWVVNIVHSLF
jgi:hypothetical protein